MDRSLTMAEFASVYLGGKSAKTGKRTVFLEGINYFIVNGKVYVKESDAEHWRQSKMITPQAPNLKTRLAQITAQVRARRKAS